MDSTDVVCRWIAELVPLAATLFSLLYGLKYFFKKGKPLCLQSITMAMASHALGSVYHICQTLTSETLIDGFTPAYLGRIGFFLFIITASYGQLDRIVDDGSPKMRPARLLAVIAPVCAVLLFVPNLLITDTTVATQVVYALVWLPATVSVYFTMKHVLIPDLDFGFVKSIKLHTLFLLLLSFAELACLTAWHYDNAVALVASSAVFAVLCVCTVVAAKKGVEKWTI